MVATLVRIQNADAVELPFNIKRPAITVYWTGGVGPFNVQYTWDDDPTFANGNGRRQQVTQNSVTSQDTAVPTADLGLLTAGTTWYLKADVIDTGDSNNNLADTGSFDYFDPKEQNRFWYLHGNVGVGFLSTDEPLERQVIQIDATGGTFTISFSGQGPTSGINYDATAGAVKTALESLSNITTVNVWKVDSQKWEVEFVDVSPTSIPAMTLGTGSLTGGGSTGTVVVVVDDADPWGTSPEGGTAGPDGDPKTFNRFWYKHLLPIVGHDEFDRPLPTQVLQIDATGGQYTLTFSGQTTGNLAYNAGASAIETALELLSNITAVTVIDMAPQKVQIEFVDVTPDPVPAITVNTGSLTGGGSTGTIVEVVPDSDAWGTAIGGTRGPQSKWDTTNRFQYLLANAGAGFDPADTPAGGWNGNTGLTSQGPGDGYAIDFNKYLYQLANVDSTQPCPYVFSISQTTIKTGESLTITGQGLVSATSPTADAYAAEVRLYASASHAASYVVLSITDYTAGSTEDSIEVSIPGGASSGFLAVVHTVGATCTGSNFKALTVQAVDPDRSAGWWIEVWNLRNSTPVVRPLKDVYEADFESIVGDIGRGSITIPADHPDIADIIDRDASPPVQSLVKVYMHDRFAYSFIPIDKDDPWDEDGVARLRIYGPGQESILRWGRCLWKDFPAQPSSARTWKYGSSENAYPIGTMDPASQITNGGLEDAVVQPWAPVGTATLFAGTTEARTGSYSLEITPTAQNDGASIEFSVQNGWREYVDVYVKDPIASGDDITVDVLDSASSVVATSTITPTTAAWNLVTLTYVPAEDATHTLRVRYTDATGTPHLIRVDDAAAYGRPNFGSGFSLARATASITRDQVAEGLHALSLACNSGGDSTFNGYVDTFAVEANRDYTMQISVQGVAGKVARVGLRLGGVLDQQDVTLTGVGTWDTITLTGTAGPDEDTGRYAVSSLNSTAEIIYVDAITVTPGAVAAPAGQVVKDVHDAMVARGTLDFIQLGFDGSLDSNGDTWAESLALDVQPAWTLFDLLDKLTGLGYDFEFAPTNYRAGGDSGWTLNLFNPSTIGENWTTVPSGPAVLPSDGVEDANPSGAPPLSTVVFAEGAGGVWSTVATDAATITALERREDFLTNTAAADATSLFRSASHRLTVAVNRGGSLTVNFVGTESDPLPYFDFLPADQLRVHLPKELRDLVVDDTYQVAAIAATLGPPRQMRFAVDFGTYRITRERAQALLLNRLIQRQETENYLPGTGSVRETRTII